MTIATWRLPMRFDPRALLADLDAIPSDAWVGHFNQSNYEGDWSGVALRVARGASTPLYPDPVAQGFEATPLLDRSPAFLNVLAAFQCELETVRLLRLSAGSLIREHRDHKLGLEDGVLRVHVPICTNPAVRFFLAGARVPMAVGEAWYLNVNLPHRVENRGSTDRVHLVIDAVVNDWVRALVADAVPADLRHANDDLPLVVPAARAPRPTAPPAGSHPAVASIVAFLREIGLEVRATTLSADTFLPGVQIVGGGLLVDEARLSYPGDLLHEAGHLAVADPARRAAMHGDAGGDPAEEMMALAWSYAAAVAIGLDPGVVFHEHGYAGGGANLAASFASGGGVGVPMLQWVGMTLDERQARSRGLPAYPAMLSWLRPEAQAAT